MKVQLKITRTVLFEKFDIKHEIRDILLSQLEDCEIKYITREYPGSIFFLKNNVYQFELEGTNPRFWINTSIYDMLKEYTLDDDYHRIITSYIMYAFKNEFDQIKNMSLRHATFMGIYHLKHDDHDYKL